MVGQDPARFRRSTTATRFPCEASDQAKNLALPLPSTTTSYSSGCDTFSPFELIPPPVVLRLVFNPYSLPFSGTVVSLVSRECRITARRRVLVLPLGFRATRCTDPDGS